MRNIERRKFLRIDCLIESYILCITEDKELDCCNGITQNISASGLFFKTKKKYKVGTIVSIEISPGVLNDLDENSGKVIKTRGFVLGRVVRIDKIKDEEYDCAVSFVSFQEDDEDYLTIFQNIINKAMYY